MHQASLVDRDKAERHTETSLLVSYFSVFGSVLTRPQCVAHSKQKVLDVFAVRQYVAIHQPVCKKFADVPHFFKIHFLSTVKARGSLSQWHQTIPTVESASFVIRSVVFARFHCFAKDYVISYTALPSSFSFSGACNSMLPTR